MTGWHMSEGLLHKGLHCVRALITGGLCLRAIALRVLGQGGYDRGLICGVFCPRGFGLRGLCLSGGI